MWPLVTKTCEMPGMGLPGVPWASHPWLCPFTGDCWFLAALGSLTQNEKHLQKILRNQSFSHQYAGIFRFWVRAPRRCSVRFSLHAGACLSGCLPRAGSLSCGRDTYV